MPAWLDPTDPDVRCGVVTGVWGVECNEIEIRDIDTVAEALEVASEILTALTAFRIHPAGQGIDDFVAHQSTYRLTPNYLPIRSVTKIERLGQDCVLDEVTDPFCVFGQSVYFSRNRQWTYKEWLWNTCGARSSGPDMLRMTYVFGSTITSSARRAVLYLAHQLWLEAEGQECELPSRVMTVSREGLQYSMLDPQDYLDRGKTGLPRVDLWLAAVNPRRARRPARVVSPYSPVPVNSSFQVIRP